MDSTILCALSNLPSQAKIKISEKYKNKMVGAIKINDDYPASHLPSHLDEKGSGIQLQYFL